jgi:heat shock protein HslJ
MTRIVVSGVLLAAALVITVPTAAAAQAEGLTPEGTEWHLVSHEYGGLEHTDVPWDLDATLNLDAGQAFGSTGCNGFSASYELDGETLTFGQPGHTDVGCSEARLDIEAGYMNALPQVVRWAIDSGSTGGADLILFNADGGHLLRFTSSDTALLVGQVRALTDQVRAQQQVIERLRARIKKLEQGG